MRSRNTDKGGALRSVYYTIEVRKTTANCLLIDHAVRKRRQVTCFEVLSRPVIIDPKE